MADINALLACVTAAESQFHGCINTDELISSVTELLPLEEGSYKINNVEGNVNTFKASIDCKLGSVDSIKSFVKSYCEMTKESLRGHTPSFPKGKSQYSSILYYRCHHCSTFEPSYNPTELLKLKPSKTRKNTDCPYSLIFKLKNDPDEFTCTIVLEYNHNHPVASLQALSFRDIPDDVSEKIRAMYEQGYTPGMAYREFVKQLKCEEPDELSFHKLLADRAKVPRRRDFNNLFTEFKKLKYGSKDLATMFTTLKQRVEELKLKETGYSISINEFNADENEPFILTIVTPLMKRVHSMVPTSGELVFMDSSGGMEEYNLRVFVMVTHTPVGALPLCIFVTSDETTLTLIKALDLLKSDLPENAFNNRGLMGPTVIMTDNCSELRDALSHAWPASILMLCIFHLMQQLWRWLFDRHHGISKGDRVEIIILFRKAMYCGNVDDMKESFASMMQSGVVVKYPNLLAYLSSLFDIKESWALCYRSSLSMRGNNTNNPIESQFLVIKDEVLNRTKEININGLLHKLTDDFMQHFKIKLLNVASGKFDGCYSSRFKGYGKKKGEGVGFKLPPESEQQRLVSSSEVIAPGIFKMESSEGSEMYTIDMNLGVCECVIGQNGSVCKHQYLLWAFGKSTSANFLPYLSSAERKMYAEIAMGASLSLEYYEGIHDRISCSAVQNVDTSELSGSQGEINVDFIINASTPISTTERISVDDCKTHIVNTMRYLEECVDANSSNNNFLGGIMKFCERVNKYPISQLGSALHSFGVQTLTSRKITAKSCLKRAKGRKIPVQPAPRRKDSDGSKRAKVKGMNVRNNPFDVVPSTKRTHKLVENICNNEAVPKKAGRTMSSKTKHQSSQKKIKTYVDNH